MRERSGEGIWENSSATVPVGPCLCSGHGMAGQQLRGTAGLGPVPLPKGHLEIQREAVDLCRQTQISLLSAIPDDRP